MVFSSMAGHMMQLDFPDSYQSWRSVDPALLFHAPVYKTINSKMQPIYKQIQTEAKKCQALCLWLDCDREGENIAFEVIDCAKKVNATIFIYHIPFSFSSLPSLHELIFRLSFHQISGTRFVLLLLLTKTSQRRPTLVRKSIFA